jgi:hypothetical protein
MAQIAEDLSDTALQISIYASFAPPRCVCPFA